MSSCKVTRSKSNKWICQINVVELDQGPYTEISNRWLPYWHSNRGIYYTIL